MSDLFLYQIILLMVLELYRLELIHSLILEDLNVDGKLIRLTRKHNMECKERISAF